MFGGVDNASSVRDDTWVWNGWSWTELAPAVSPAARARASHAYDPVNQHLLMFGGDAFGVGTLGDFWTFDGADWTRRYPATLPDARSQAAMAFHDASGEALLFGGHGTSGVRGDTWTWNGTTWRQRTQTQATPRARVRHAMAADQARGNVVLFGGRDDLNGSDLADTWTWNGTRWVARYPSNPPPAMSGHGLAWDEYRQLVVLTAEGETASQPLRSWGWDGSDWTELVTDAAPSQRQYALTTSWGALDGVWLFGGRDDTFQKNELLHLLDVYRVPSHVALVRAGEAQLGDGEVRRVTVRWNAGASGQLDDGSPADGVVLAFWDGQGWAGIVGHDAGADAPQELCWSIRRDASVPVAPGCADLVDPTRLDRILTGPDQTLGLAAISRGATFRGNASLVTEDYAATIDYRLPE